MPTPAGKPPIGDRQRRWRVSLSQRGLREIRLTIPEAEEPAVRKLAAWLRENRGRDWAAWTAGDELIV